ncbi:heterokaryon incompatibility protein-domain-containing protein [Stachybotrys elegans]|uniref:Heterokaryon incompatibility protein-domain-containing protein n=1 Tax=Stachybotrys elegans TaxID=80388 RepID=A0A8K0STU5_9HYPO|nr:heterokaryon incompatibility protein-domain-containing protein [Stachybotrys elegans]
MAENPSLAATPERPPIPRRSSRNPIRSMMQHLTVDAAEDDGSPSKRESLIRRLSRRASRSSSTHSDHEGHTNPSAQDPALCQSCASWATDVQRSFGEIDAQFLRPLNPVSADAFDSKEFSVAILKGLSENRWSTTCPLCKLFWAVHIPSEGDGEYCLSGFSSRDTNYLIDAAKLAESAHPAKGKARGFTPAFLGVVPRMKGPNALSWDVDPDWFRATGMLFRTLPLIEEMPKSAISNDGRSSRNPSRNPSRNASPVDSSAWLRQGIWGREIGQRIDMSVGLDWLRYCEFHHQGRCGRRPILAEMQGFRLIDCLSQPPQVVNASIKEHYVALSYVWGSETSEAWPRVFRDAVQVTQELGMQYLWIDRICIDDSQQDLKMMQIYRMNEIYEGATLTVIAACGEDATYGLPGMGSTSRHAQPKYKFPNADITLVSSMPDPRISVKKSAWYKRGWTYQEGHLARRRLIFTDQQMYWECEGMTCQESLALPLDLYHDQEEERMCDFMRPGLLNGVKVFEGSWESWKRLPRAGEEATTLSIFREMDQHVSSFTKRELSYDQDSLHAFLGLSRHVESTMGVGKLTSLIGIPLWTPVDETGHRMTNARTRDLFALSTSFWHHREGHKARRRPNLPSWTWAGWQGAVDLHSSIVIAEGEGKLNGRKFFSHHYVAATQLTRSGPTSKWVYSPEMVVLNPDGGVAYDFRAESVEGLRKGVPRLAPRRYLLRVTTPLVLDRVKAKTHAGGWAFNHLSVDVRLSSGDLEASGIRGYVERHARGEQMTVLWFVEETLVMLLVVQRTERNTWERVGRMRMGFADEAKDVMQRCGRLEALLEELPLRRLAEDIILE